MTTYSFEVQLTLSEIVDVEADNEEDAAALAQLEAERYYCVTPEGFSIPWDDIQIDPCF